MNPQGTAEMVPETRDRVTAEIARRYRARDLEVVVGGKLNGVGPPLYADVFIPEIKRVERVESVSTLEDLDLSVVDEYRRAGYEVWITIPLDELWLGHDRLRRTVDRIQGWWEDRGEVRFGSPRVP